VGVSAPTHKFTGGNMNVKDLEAKKAEHEQNVTAMAQEVQKLQTAIQQTQSRINELSASILANRGAIETYESLILEEQNGKKKETPEKKEKKEKKEIVVEMTN